MDSGQKDDLTFVGSTGDGGLNDIGMKVGVTMQRVPLVVFWWLHVSI